MLKLRTCLALLIYISWSNLTQIFKEGLGSQALYSDVSIPANSLERTMHDADRVKAKTLCRPKEGRDARNAHYLPGKVEKSGANAEESPCG